MYVLHTNLLSALDHFFSPYKNNLGVPLATLQVLAELAELAIMKIEDNHGKQCSPYLCGGVFFLLLTEAKEKPASRRQLQSGLKDRVSNKNILEALIQLIVPSFHQPSVGKTFGGDTSDYRACKVSHGLNLPFDDTTEIDGFDNRVKSQYQSVVRQMDTFVDNFLHTKSDERMRWLIQAILTLLSEDHSVTDGTLFIFLNLRFLRKSFWPSTNTAFLRFFLLYGTILL